MYLLANEPSLVVSLGTGSTQEANTLRMSPTRGLFRDGFLPRLFRAFKQSLSAIGSEYKFQSRQKEGRKERYFRFDIEFNSPEPGLDWIAFMLREYEANKNPQKTVNLLRAVQWTRAAQETSVTTDTIQRCWWKSTLIKKPTPEELAQVAELKGDTIIVDDGTDRIELQDQITQLPIKDLLSLDEFLNPEAETIVNKDEDIFTSVVNHYAITRPGEEEESSDKEEVKEVDTAKALRVVETVKMQKLQKGDSQDL